MGLKNLPNVMFLMVPPKEKFAPKIPYEDDDKCSYEKGLNADQFENIEDHEFQYSVNGDFEDIPITILVDDDLVTSVPHINLGIFCHMDLITFYAQMKDLCNALEPIPCSNMLCSTYQIQYAAYHSG
jgi:hypothetical protein